MDENETKEKVNNIENNRENPLPITNNDERIENLDGNSNNDEFNKPDSEGLKKDYASEAIPKRMNGHDDFRKTLDNKNYYKEEADRLKQRKDAADAERKNKTKEVPKQEDNSKNNNNTENINKSDKTSDNKKNENSTNDDNKKNENKETEEKKKNSLDKARDAKNSAAARMGMLNNKINDAKSKAYMAQHPGEAGKEILEAKFKKALLLLMKNPMFWLVILIILFLLFLFFLVIFLTGEANADYDGYSSEYSGICSAIPVNNTNLSKSEFVELVQTRYANGSASQKLFSDKADSIYDIATENNINPELVVIRAAVEGFSPGTNYNYWGIGCTNGCNSCCKSYSSFSGGINSFIKTISSYTSIADFYHYAYIGNYWLNPGDPANGGCYYFPFIKKYMSSSRASVVSDACDKNKPCSGSACLKTTDEDQKAYSQYQSEVMVGFRTSIFNIGAEVCDDNESTETVDSSSLGYAVLKYAEATFDSYRYDQGLREQVGYVDCSSMVARAYKHFNMIIYDTYDNTYGELAWCQRNNKLISESELAPGDLILFGYSPHHVAMYAGNDRQFAAHGKEGIYANNYEAQVSEIGYLKGSGTWFCRPSK